MTQIIRIPIKENTTVDIYKFKPSPNRIIPNDKLSQIIPNLPNVLKDENGDSIGEAIYQEYMKRDLGFTIVEVATAKYGSVLSDVKVSLKDGYFDFTSLDQFDKEVLIACISDQQYGNAVTTVDAIYRNITGADDSTHPHPEMRERILRSIRKLRHHDIRIDMSKICSVRKDYTPEGGPVIESAILPGWVLEKASVNGQIICDVIKFDRPSPLFIVAQAKKQLFSYARWMIGGGGIVNSPQNIVLRNYVQQRIEAIRHHPRTKNNGLYPTITFADLYQHLKVDEGTCSYDTIKKRKKRIRDTLFKFLDFLWRADIINGYEVIQDGKEFVAVDLKL